MDFLSEIGIQRWQRRNNMTPRPNADAVVSETSVTEAPSEPQQIDKPDAQLSNSVADQVDSKTRSDKAPDKNKTAESGTIENPPVPADSWANIIADMESAKFCPVCQSATPILGEGKQTADWVFVIDAPSNQDISEQQLLSGRAGKLFDNMLRAINLQRSDVYLTSIFKCPPSENLKLSPSCNDLLLRQLALIAPAKVVTFGEFTAQTLLKSNDPLTTLRGSLHTSRSLKTSVLSTHSVTDCLSKPSLKALVWQDLCQLFN